MDPTIAVAVIAAASAVVGPPLTWALTRRHADRAAVGLTDAQTDQIRQDIYERLVTQLRGEIGRLQTRITDLEARVASLDTALRERTAELEATRAERDVLRVQLEETRVRLAAREQELAVLKAAS